MCQIYCNLETLYTHRVDFNISNSKTNFLRFQGAWNYQDNSQFEKYHIEWNFLQNLDLRNVLELANLIFILISE